LPLRPFFPLGFQALNKFYFHQMTYDQI
jgi:hypothetical protein